MLNAASNWPQNAPKSCLQNIFSSEGDKRKEQKCWSWAVYDTKFASGFVTDKVCLRNTFTRNYRLYHDRQKFKSKKMSLFLTELWTRSILPTRPCASKSPSQETDSEPQRTKDLKIFIFISPIQLEEAYYLRCGIATVYFVYTFALQYMQCDSLY